ncbi:hypothetical protein lerEdw1_020261 [Lerista edwardsae]|nr:hypothetical protein lerEdw1_020261 [Lerista edwardsae]
MVYHRTDRKGEHDIESPTHKGVKATSPGFKPLIIERASSGFGFSFRNCPPGYRMENLLMDVETGNEKGDSIICVNGKSVLGKTCSEVATLIQNCSILELTIVPSKEDMLNPTYPQDAYRDSNTDASPVPL